MEILKLKSWWGWALLCWNLVRLLPHLASAFRRLWLIYSR